MRKNENQSHREGTRTLIPLSGRTFLSLYPEVTGVVYSNTSLNCSEKNHQQNNNITDLMITMLA